MSTLAIVAVVIMIIGIVGMIHPLFPGTIVVFLGPLIYVIFNGFKEVTIPIFVIMVILTVIGFFVDNIFSFLGVKKFGASKRGLLGAVVGGMAGLLLFNIAGFILGQFIGVIVVEFLYGKEFKKSLSAGIGVFIGYIVGYILKIVLAGTILILFVTRFM